MDNENKISSDIHEGVQLFLRDVQPADQTTSELYDLNKEYAKTRHNHTPHLVFPMVLCILLVVLTTAFIVFFVYRTNENITVSVDAFEDLNLASLLDTVSETRANRDGALKEQSDLQVALQAEIDSAERNRDAEYFTIESLGLSSREEANRKRTADTEYNKAVEAAHAQFDPLIAEQQELVQRYQTQLDEYDTSRLQLAREKEAAMNSQKRLFEMEKQELVSSYEDTIASLQVQMQTVQEENLERQLKAVNDITQKYQAEINGLDPVVEDEQALALVSQTGLTGLSERFDPVLFTENLTEAASQDFLDAVTRAESLFADFDYSQSFVSSLPQKNSIPSFVRTASRLAHTAGNELVQASTQEVNRLASVAANYRQRAESADVRNNEYSQSLLQIARLQSADGIVVSQSSDGTMEILLLPEAATRMRVLITPPDPVYAPEVEASEVESESEAEESDSETEASDVQPQSEPAPFVLPSVRAKDYKGTVQFTAQSDGRMSGDLMYAVTNFPGNARGLLVTIVTE